MKKLFWGLASLGIILAYAFQWFIADMLGASIETKVYVGAFGTAYTAIFFTCLLVLCIYKTIKNKSVIAAVFIVPALIASLALSWATYFYCTNTSTIIDNMRQQQETTQQLKHAEESGTEVNIAEITSADQLNTLVATSKLPVVVKCSAEWCGPCKMMKPTYKLAAINYTDQITFTDVDTDKAPAISEQLSIKGLPTFVCFKDGKEAFRVVGYKKKSEFMQELQKLVA